MWKEVGFHPLISSVYSPHEWIVPKPTVPKLGPDSFPRQHFAMPHDHWVISSGQGQLGFSQGLWYSSPLATDCPTHTSFIICQLICYSWWLLVAIHNTTHALSLCTEPSTAELEHGWHLNHPVLSEFSHFLIQNWFLITSSSSSFSSLSFFSETLQTAQLKSSWLDQQRLNTVETCRPLLDCCWCCLESLMVRCWTF